MSTTIAGERPTESDPTGRSSHTPGAKLDAGKVPILQGALEYFPNALREVAQVSYVGAKKYTWKGWETVPDGINRYGNALARHLLATEMYDADTGMLHAAQVAWNALARLELILREQKVIQIPEGTQQSFTVTAGTSNRTICSGAGINGGFVTYVDPEC